MGFYSYTCAKTNLPIMASTSWGDDYSKVVVLGQTGSIFQGIYDGYGRVLTSEGMEIELDDSAILSGKIKLVCQKFYAGEKFEDLPKSRNELGQGHFHNEEKVQEWYDKGGFPSWKEYAEAYTGKDSTEPTNQTSDHT